MLFQLILQRNQCKQKCYWIHSIALQNQFHWLMGLFHTCCKLVNTYYTLTLWHILIDSAIVIRTVFNCMCRLVMTSDCMYNYRTINNIIIFCFFLRLNDNKWFYKNCYEWNWVANDNLKLEWLKQRLAVYRSLFTKLSS